MTAPGVHHEPDGRLTVQVSVTLDVEVKEGWRYRSPSAGGPVLFSGAGEHSFYVEDVRDRVRDVLVDQTKHDDTIAWRITDVTVDAW